jgi:hypothetical protein
MLKLSIYKKSLPAGKVHEITQLWQLVVACSFAMHVPYDSNLNPLRNYVSTALIL